MKILKDNAVAVVCIATLCVCMEGLYMKSRPVVCMHCVYGGPI